MSLGDTNDINNKGNNYPWQRAVIELLKSISSGVSSASSSLLTIIANAVTGGSSYGNRNNFIYGKTASITDNNDHQVIASLGATTKMYITQILVTNGHATVSTYVNIKAGASTVLYTGYAAAKGGGFSLTFPTPLVVTSSADLVVACETNGSDVRMSASGYSGA